MQKQFDVELTKTEVRTFKTTVRVKSDNEVTALDDAIDCPGLEAVAWEEFTDERRGDHIVAEYAEEVEDGEV